MSEASATPKFQFSLGKLIAVYLAISCEIGLCVLDFRLGVFVLVCFVLGYGLIYRRTRTVSVLACLGLAGFVYVETHTCVLPSRYTPSAARLNLKRLSTAIEHYQSDKGSFPDDANAQTLFFALVPHNGDTVYAQFISDTDEMNNHFTSRWGKTYISYKKLTLADGRERGFILIDPGPDGLLGGTIDPVKGFVPDGTGADLDNVTYDSTNKR